MMNAEEARRRFAELVFGQDADFDLVEAALLIAVEEYPGLEPDLYLERLRGMADEVGHRLGPDRDPQHIIAAINRAATQKPPNKLWSVYIGVYSDDDKKHIEQLAGQFRCKVHVYNAKTADIWGTKK